MLHLCLLTAKFSTPSTSSQQINEFFPCSEETDVFPQTEVADWAEASPDPDAVKETTEEWVAFMKIQWSPLIWPLVNLTFSVLIWLVIFQQCFVNLAEIMMMSFYLFLYVFNSYYLSGAIIWIVLCSWNVTVCTTSDYIVDNATMLN